MSYRVNTESFSGPFDLLLHLVARRKLDIGQISIVGIAEEYLSYIERMEKLDLDVASDFLLVASQLLEIKSASLLPQDEPESDDEFADLDADQTREILIARLIAYRQFKTAALELGGRYDAEGRMHARQAGLEPEFVDLVPDYLEGITLRGLAVICADLDSRKDLFLLEAEHIASMPIPVELHMESVRREIGRLHHSTFSHLAGESADIGTKVVTFLALLELYKRRVIDITQSDNFGEIGVELLERKGQDDVSDDGSGPGNIQQVEAGSRPDGDIVFSSAKES